MIGNITNTETTKQGFCPSPPSKPNKSKPPENCFRSYIDQIQGGFYSGSKLVRSSPRKTSDSYFVVRTLKAEVRSYRRNYSHRSVALYRTKRDGSTRGNIAYLTCSFLELDGSTDNTIKSLEDVLTLARNNNFLEGLQTSVTSRGHYHVIWTYNDPLPWNERNESYWISQQRRLIQLFQKAGFNVDKGASLNPCQNLRNPSQLQPYNWKRKCKVEIHKSYSKTSLRAIYRALNEAGIPNPKPIPASDKFRRFLRENETFTLTHKELAESIGVSERTVRTEVRRAVRSGDLQIVRKTGNNKRFLRATEYLSNLHIEAYSQNGNLSSIKTNSVQTEALIRDFKRKGTSVGRRQKTLFALGLFLKHKLGKRACVEAIRAELEGGAMRCHVSVREFERVLKSIMKPVYTNPFSLAKMREWDLIVEPKHFH